MDFSQTEQNFVVKFDTGSGGSGQDGFSPIVEVNPIDGGHRIIITDIQGTESFDVMNGKDGKQGEKGDSGHTPQKGIDYFDGKDGKDGSNGKDGVDGEDGYTPQKGVDYWTEEDINAINSYIDNKFDTTISEALEGDY